MMARQQKQQTGTACEAGTNNWISKRGLCSRRKEKTSNGENEVSIICAKAVEREDANTLGAITG